MAILRSLHTLASQTELTHKHIRINATKYRKIKCNELVFRKKEILLKNPINVKTK